MRQDWLQARSYAPDRCLFAAVTDTRRARFHSWRRMLRFVVWHPSIFNDPTYIVDTIRCEHSPPTGTCH